MGSFAESADLAVHPGFRRRVQISMLVAAKDVAAEAVNENDPQRSQARRGLATNVLLDPDGFAGKFVWAVASNPVVNLASPDGEIQFVVNSVWDAFAGLPPAAS